MKFAALFGVAVLAGVGYFMTAKHDAGVDSKGLPLDPVARAEWRRTTVEAETKVRPASFEQMKWHPEDGAAPELRAPASTKKKSKK